MAGILKNIMNKSPWVVHVNCNSCNGCDIEFLACLTPLYDAERLGIMNIGTPKQADILVVTGSANHKNIDVLKNIYAGLSWQTTLTFIHLSAYSEKPNQS